MADHTPPTKAADEHRNGQMGQGGDTRRGAADDSRRGRSPDDRSTLPDASATNHDHPSAPGTVAGHAGGGLDSGAGTAVNSPPAAIDSTDMTDATRGLLNGGVNRVEDQKFTATPRLNPASDDAGPGPSAGTPELQDPNYTAASERAKK